MSGTARCPLCNHVRAIHDRDGSCPRWSFTGTLNAPALRVVLRVAHKWPGCEGHTLVYLPECVNAESGMVLVWDLTTDGQIEAPTLTVRGPWTRAPSNDEKQNAIDELKMRTGERVNALRYLV